MDDEKIISLYFERNEDAIVETEQKYGKLCYYIAYHILNQVEDSQECVNDTYIHIWNDIPPTYPRRFKAYIAKITRNLSINLLEKKSAFKRGHNQVSVALDELGECIPSSSNDPIDHLHEKELAKSINNFMNELNEQERNIFIQRYFFLEKAEDIAIKYHMKKSNVFNILSRTRKKLYDYLTREGYSL